MYMPNPKLDDVLKQFDQIKLEKDKFLFLMIGERVKFEVELLLKRLRDNNINFFGGVFPGVISGNKHSTDAIYFLSMSVLQKPLIVEDISKGNFSIPDLREQIANKKETTPTILILVDGMSSKNELFLRELFNVHGKSVNYVGGGAGSLSFKQMPCIFDNHGFYSDTTLIIPLKQEMNLSVKHGWKSLHGPLVATKTKKNVIKELNWDIAFDIYQTYVNADLNNEEEITKDNFFDYSKRYPFGIHKEGYENIVRDPIAVDDEGGLICVGEVPQNAILYLLKGEKEQLINAVKMATLESLKGTHRGVKYILMIDCISRSIFLENQFSTELDAVNEILSSDNSDNEVFGFLSLGEISSYGEGQLEFFNKTCVIGVFDKVDTDV